MKKLTLRKEAILPRIDGITRNMEKLRELGKKSLSEFEERGDVFDLAQHHLRLALEGIFHIGSHILSRLSGARPTSYKEIAQRLGEKGVVKREFADNRLVKMAGFRNRLTHFYHDITPKEIYGIINNDLVNLEEFLQAVEKVVTAPQDFDLTIE